MDVSSRHHCLLVLRAYSMPEQSALSFQKPLDHDCHAVLIVAECHLASSPLHALHGVVHGHRRARPREHRQVVMGVTEYQALPALQPQQAAQPRQRVALVDPVRGHLTETRARRTGLQLSGTQRVDAGIERVGIQPCAARDQLQWDLVVVLLMLFAQSALD